MNWREILGLPEEEVDVTNLVGDVQEPRPQHYLFAHRFLPALSFEMGALVALVLSNPDKAPTFLREAWQDVAQQNKIAPEEQIAPEGLQASVERVGERLFAIVQLPPPQTVTEAYFVAIVCDLPPEPKSGNAEAGQSLVQQLKHAPLHYYTLEYGYSLDNTPRTTFCEWTKGGSHLNMGDGPKPTQQEFLAFLRERN